MSVTDSADTTATSGGVTTETPPHLVWQPRFNTIGIEVAR